MAAAVSETPGSDDCIDLTADSDDADDSQGGTAAPPLADPATVAATAPRPKAVAAAAATPAPAPAAEPAAAAVTAASEATATAALAPTPAAVATGAAGSSSAGLTLHQLRQQYKGPASGPLSKNERGCQALACLARLLSDPDSGVGVDEVQVSTLLPHLGTLLQHLQRGLVSGVKGARDSNRSSTSAKTHVPSPNTAVM